MRLADTGDTDIALDADGQPVRSETGAAELVTGMECLMQDIWIEMQTEEGELIHEDDEGRYAYGYSLKEFLNAEFDDDVQAEIEARIYEKLTKREDIEEGSIKISFSQVDQDCRKVHISFAMEETEENVAVDISINRDGVYVT